MRKRLWYSGLVLAAYYAGGRIGLAVPFTSGNVSPVWPPSGIALAAMLVFGFRVWPAVAIAAFLVNFFSPVPPLTALGIAVGNTIGPMCGAWLLQRVPGFRPALVRLRDVVVLIALGGLGGTAITATLGTLVLWATHVKAWSGIGSTWLIWWLGDAMGVLVVAPLVLTAGSLSAVRRGPRLAELVALLAGTVTVCALIFGTHPGRGHDILALALFPFVMWGAIRFEAAGAAVSSCLIAVMAVWNTSYNRGPFVDSTSLHNAALMQSFLALVAVSGLSVAALIAERTQLVRERAEREAARRGEQRYREIAETANEGVWMLDSELLTCFVNRRMAEMLRYPVREMLGKPVTAFMFEEDVAGKRAELERRRHGVSEQVENRYRRKDGSVLWTRISTTASCDAAGRFTGALAMVSDITEQKRNEAEGKQARNTILLLSRAVEQTADSVLVTDKRGIIEYVNPAFEETTGYRRDEAVGRTPAILKSGHHDREFYQRLWHDILGGHPFRGTLVNRKRGGELYWAEQTITPITNDEGEITHFVSVLKDITELRRKQEQEVQLRLARQVQQQFNRGPIALPGLDVSAASHPAAETGGDYFDFIRPSDDVMYVAIGDASGHGFSSALVIALTRAYVRSFATLDLDVCEILSRVNRMLTGDLEDNRFVTLLLARFDARRRLLSYASAGHVPGYVLCHGGAVQAVLESTGPPLGVFAHAEFPHHEVRLEKNQTVLLVTDGVTESEGENDEPFGAERLLEYVRGHRDWSAHHVTTGIYQAARAFAGTRPQVDDITSVVAKVQ